MFKFIEISFTVTDFDNRVHHPMVNYLYSDMSLLQNMCLCKKKKENISQYIFIILNYQYQYQKSSIGWALITMFYLH